MHWKRLGKIFDPAEHGLHVGYGEFAQAPSVLLHGDFVRVYFSTRTRDDHGAKYRSHVAYVDMDHELSRVVRLSGEPVLPLGALGCFDEHGIFPISVIRHKGLVYGYTCGWSWRLRAQSRRRSAWRSVTTTDLRSSGFAMVRFSQPL